MNKKLVISLVTALLIGSIGTYTLLTFTTARNATTADRPNAELIPAGMHRMPDGTLMDHSAMEMGNPDQPGHMMDMMVTSERAFIVGMIPHHQEAVDTAKEVIARGGTTPEIAQLVENIVVAQEQEIAEMKAWHADWYNEPYRDTGDYQPMMRELADLSGSELDRVFLEDMIMHHMGAIMMAESVQPYIEHAEVAELSRTIISTQAEEIRLMRTLLGNL